MEIHFVPVKVSVVWRAHTLVKPKCPVRFDPGLCVSLKSAKNYVIQKDPTKIFLISQDFFLK